MHYNSSEAISIIIQHLFRVILTFILKSILIELTATRILSSVKQIKRCQPPPEKCKLNVKHHRYRHSIV